WATMHEIIDEPAKAGFIVQRVAAPGVPVTAGGMEDPLFGPVVSFGVSGAATELLGDRSYRIPPMHGGEAAEMVREIKAAPMLFGYRGAELVDVDAVENLLLRVAQLKNDLPQLHTLDLNLILAGAHGATVLDARGRVEPVADARSDWYVRRLSAAPGDTLHG
ncbi:MAG TPA: acetate--CoA ligase family protein, partial [Nocardioidaceae bacterium]